MKARFSMDHELSFLCTAFGRFIVAAAASLFLTFCSSTTEIDTSNPEGMFKLGEKFIKDERYEEAIAQFSQIRNKHPYSKLATEAELRIADIYFEREEYIEAQSSYQTFKEMHPAYSRIDYVTFRLAMSFFNQLPSSIDRDLSISERAILYFDEVSQSYAQSEYAPKAIEHKAKIIAMLAEKEFYIADFYYIRKFYLSALGRFEGLLEKYPNSVWEIKALYSAIKSAVEVKELGKAKNFYQKLMASHGSSDEAKKAREELGSRIE